MIISKLLILVGFLLTQTGHAQEATSVRYFDERAKGDAAAEENRNAFANMVCEAAVEVFCPGVTFKPNSPCYKKQKDCGSPSTIVVKRFLSKYGVGFVSAKRDALPTIKRIFQVLKEIENNRKLNGNGISASVQKRIPYIAETTELSIASVEADFTKFSKKYFPNKLTTITVDYWGYFQQSSAGRPRFEFDKDAQRGSLTLNFRWCGMKHRFVDESAHMVGDVLSAAVMDPDAIKHFVSEATYNKSCENLPDEKGDIRTY